MKDLKIVFMGTPDFAVSILKKLVEQKYEVVGVITAPDKPAGRGRKLNESAVKRYAVQNNLKLLQPTNLKEPSFLEALKALKADLQIVVAFRMLPKAVWSLPALGTFNLHASLLPDYRGAAPINWALINGEVKTGVTTFFLDDKIDTGAIILQKEIAIGKEETVGMLHDKLMYLGGDLVLETVEQIQKGTVTTTKQPEKTPKVAFKIHKDTCKIDWHSSMDAIHNKIRGLDPYPAAWTHLQNDGIESTVKLFGAVKEQEKHAQPIGKVVTDKKNIKIAVEGGYLMIQELQLSGKKRMAAASLLNGYHFHKDAKMV